MRVEILEKLLSQQKIPKFCIFKGLHLANNGWEPNNPYHFLKKLNEIFQMHLNILSKLWLIVCCHQEQIQNMSYFRHFNDHNSGGKHGNQTNDPIFLIDSLGPIRWHISYLHLKKNAFLLLIFKIQCHGVPLLHYGLVCKLHIYIPKILSSLLTEKYFFYIKFAVFWYVTSFVPNGVLNWPRSHRLCMIDAENDNMLKIVWLFPCPA